MLPLSVCCLCYLALKVWTVEDCATLQIVSGSVPSMISDSSFKEKPYSIPCSRTSLLEFLWILGRSSKHCCYDEELPFAMHQGYSDFSRWYPEYCLYCNYDSSGNLPFLSNVAFLCCKIWDECISFLWCWSLNFSINGVKMDTNVTDVTF